jgi:hypothetical protein
MASADTSWPVGHHRQYQTRDRAHHDVGKDDENHRGLVLGGVVAPPIEQARADRPAGIQTASSIRTNCHHFTYWYRSGTAIDDVGSDSDGGASVYDGGVNPPTG